MKKVFVCMIVLVVVSVSLAVPVNIPDPNLKAAIEAKLGIPNPDATQMLLLTRLDANSLEISDLTGLETATNLQRLRLNLNSISDVNKLSGLTKLWYLNLMDNNITDINSLGKLTKLVYLYLDRNDDISDINAVKDMNSLIELGLIDVNLVDISPLADVNQIKYLYLGTNHIQDISALTGYFKLIRLNLAYNNPLSFDSRCDYLHQIVANNSGNPGFSASPSISNDISINSTDANDLRIFADQWLKGNCSIDNGYCNCADSTVSGRVNFDDFVDFADVWVGM